MVKQDDGALDSVSTLGALLPSTVVSRLLSGKTQGPDRRPFKESSTA